MSGETKKRISDLEVELFEARRDNNFLVGVMSNKPTLRDQFAISALNGYLSTHESWFRTTDEHRGNITARAYLWADAMMKARTA